MKVVKGNTLQFIPASHENPQNPGVLKKVLFKQGDLPSGIIQMVNWAKITPGKSFQAHYHEDMEEVFILIKGSVRAQIGVEQVELTAGDAIAVPKHVPHSFLNTGTDDVEYVMFGISEGKGGKTVVVP